MPSSPVIDTNESVDNVQLSIVIATCNRAEQIGRALESLCHQSIPAKSFEVIVVDNGSGEATRVVVQDYLKGQPHWKLLQEPKPGAAAARNSGIRAARSSIVLFLDDDIVADPKLIEQHLTSHRKCPGTAVLGAVRFPWKGDESAFFWCLGRHPELFQSFQFPDPGNVPFQYFYTCNLSLSKSFFNQAEGFDESFTTSGFEDTELGYRFIKAGFRIIFNEKASALHDVRTTFRQFSQKRYASGQWARQFVNMYPEVRRTFLGGSPFKNKISSLVGFLAILLRPLFGMAKGPLNRPLLPALGILCWHHLQYCFRTGFSANSLPQAAYLQKQSPVNSMK
jgi:GT2 family glycosyltransferase